MKFQTTISLLASLLIMASVVSAQEEQDCRSCLNDHTSVCAEECKMGLWGEEDEECPKLCGMSKCKSSCIAPKVPEGEADDRSASPTPAAPAEEADTAVNVQ